MQSRWAGGQPEGPGSAGSPLCREAGLLDAAATFRDTVYCRGAVDFQKRGNGSTRSSHLPCAQLALELTSGMGPGRGTVSQWLLTHYRALKSTRCSEHLGFSLIACFCPRFPAGAPGIESSCLRQLVVTRTVPRGTGQAHWTPLHWGLSGVCVTVRLGCGSGRRTPGECPPRRRVQAHAEPPTRPGDAGLAHLAGCGQPPIPRPQEGSGCASRT